MLALAFDTTTCEGDVVYDAGCLVAEGFDLETAVILSLLTDAPAQAGDVLPEGTPRRGFWADAFEADSTVLGSRLWLLEGSETSQATADKAKAYASEALGWLLTGRYVRAVDFATQVGDEAIELTVLVTLKDGKQVPLGPFGVT